MTKSEIIQLIAAIVLPNAGGILSGLLYSPNKSDWYKNLLKPDWAPPSWVYAPIWTALYSFIGYASYIVWKDGNGFKGSRLALTLYGAQLVINWAWMPLVFGFESLKLGLMDLGVLIPLIAACIVKFFKVNHTAGSLMVPYFLWTGFATYLNYTMYKINETSNK